MAISLPSKTVHVNGVNLAYVEHGQGEPVVFVHGSVNDYRAWGAQMAPFGERYRVVAFSRRYHWPNARPDDGIAYAVAEHVADRAALIESLGLAPAHIVGSSYGALTALTLAVERPDLVRSLVLGEPPPLPWLARLPDGLALLDAFMTNAFAPVRETFARGEAEAGVRTFTDGVLGAGAFDNLQPGARATMMDNAAAEHVETRRLRISTFPLCPPRTSVASMFQRSSSRARPARGCSGLSRTSWRGFFHTRSGRRFPPHRTAYTPTIPRATTRPCSPFWPAPDELNRVSNFRVSPFT